MTASLASRLWIYQSERFPLKKTAPLLAMFSAASICASATLSGRELPGAGAFIAGFIVAMCLFFQMRVCDEVKDYADDLKYRPERAIPRGLVSMKLIVGLGIATVPLAIAVVWAWHPPALWLLAIVWAWLTVMTFEFGAPVFLKARPVLYLISHMMIMPLIDLLLTGMEWMPGGGASPSLWLFLALSFVNGCVLEIGRKLWAPENEIAGVDSYSATWGIKQASTAWAFCLLVSFGLLCGVGIASKAALPVIGLGAVGLGFGLWTLKAYVTDPTPKTQDNMDKVAGLWVFLCYAVAGFVPLIFGAA